MLDSWRGTVGGGCTMSPSAGVLLLSFSFVLPQVHSLTEDSSHSGMGMKLGSPEQTL